MRRSTIILFALPVLAVGFLYAWVRLSSEFGGWEEPATSITVEPPKHVVTPRMAEASRGMVLRQAPDFRSPANDGAEYSLRELIRKGPVLLTFTKIGCPCSEAAQPFFNRLASTYPRVRVLGVIDGELGPANLGAQKMRLLAEADSVMLFHNCS